LIAILLISEMTSFFKENKTYSNFGVLIFIGDWLS